ncbi:MAG TPA: threonine ammonia-lyase, biosynthetic [Gammaproteobacteria bacterium]|nr:threonine ammonia-lyase, biosynthetic [Gammaproteobacteria bacterium]
MLLSLAAMIDTYIRKILNARVYDVAEKTPLEKAPNLSDRIGSEIFLKREDLQPVFSFKLRGAYNKIAGLDEQARARGVVCSSAGNHAQGVALAARRLGIRATIVMPRTTPPIKVQAVRKLGGRAVLHGDAYDDAYEYARRLTRERGMTFVHPYDDPEVIAGQGTVAMELLQQHSGALDAVFIPVGGGGLLAGMASYIKYVRPEIRIIGVEPDDAASMTEALRRHRRVRLKQVGLFTDGVAVRQAGKEPFRVARETVDDMVTVSTDEVCAAIRDIYEDTRSIAEPAGALATAGAKRYLADRAITGWRVAAVIGGANMNFDRLRHVAERTELGEHREALLAVTIPERPGSFLHFCRDISKRTITEFNYRYADAAQAHVFAGVKLEDGVREKDELVASLRGAGYTVVDMAGNEMAKLHIRYMVGGHAPLLENERVYRFEFPERPGALLRFLTRIGRDWNISLFHYRNHGADFGRALVGMQIPSADLPRFREKIDKLGYGYADETDNPAYDLFLSPGK